MEDINIQDLARSCEDYLVHRYIPLRSTNDEDIIQHALKEGYQLGKYMSEVS